MRWWWVAGSVALGCPSGDDSGQDGTLSTTFGTDGTTTVSTTLGTDVTSATMTASTTTTADSSGTDVPIFDVGGVETGDETGTIGDICKVEDGEISGDAPCEKVAPPDSFSPDVQWSYMGPPGQVSCMTTPLVVNLTDDNADGEIDLCDIPDVVTVIGAGETGPGTIITLAGDTGELQLMFGNGVQGGITPALGDIDGDGLVEIVSANGSAQIVAFEHDGTPKWTSSATWAANQTGALALADLDNDGDVEIIAGSNVFDHDGNLVFTAPFDGIYSASMAADLDGDGDLEVVLGHAAYHHDGTEYWLRPELQAAQFSITSYPQVANLDDDPEPEVLIASENGAWLLEHDGTVIWSNFAPTGESGDWNRPVNIHDFDGDNEAEFALSSYEHYAVYEVDQTSVFVANVIDFSGQAGGTAFDFLGSGIAQAIYADETTSWVFDIDGSVLMSTPRSSGTWTEYPTVADIDNDGSAEILVGSDGFGSPTLQAIRDLEDRWIPARRIWNQHTYHVTNVLEDGRIPQFEPPNWETLNTFRTQAQIGAGGGVCKPPAG
jgi:hypothetical protein